VDVVRHILPLSILLGAAAIILSTSLHFSDADFVLMDGKQVYNLCIVLAVKSLAGIGLFSKIIF
jgi:hypothetical protein